MKRWIVFFSFIAVFMLSGCENQDASDIGLEGEYDYFEAVYLNLLSSSTLDAETDKMKGICHVVFEESSVFQIVCENSYIYEDIEYREEDVKKDLDELLSLDFDNVFDRFDKRYDLYSEDKAIGYTIFFDGDQIFLATTRYIGGSNDIFTVWIVYEITKDQVLEGCSKTTSQVAYSGIRWENYLYECVTPEYTYWFRPQGFSKQDTVDSGVFSIKHEGELLHFLKCEPNDVDLQCDGNWNLLEKTEENPLPPIEGQILRPLQPAIDYRSLNLDWFEPIEDVEENEWLIDDYDLQIRAEYKEELHRLVYGFDCPDCSETDSPFNANMYLKLDEEMTIRKVFYLTFPSLSIEYHEFDEIIEIPEEIIELIERQE